MVMINHRKQGTPSITQQKQATVKLLPYKKNKTTILPEQDGSKKKRPMPLFLQTNLHREEARFSLSQKTTCDCIIMVELI